MTKSKPFGNLTMFGYDLNLTNINTIEGRGQNQILHRPDNPEKTGLCHWIATTIKPIHHTRCLVGLGARGKSRISSALRLLLLLAILGPQPLSEGQNIPVY